MIRQHSCAARIRIGRPREGNALFLRHRSTIPVTFQVYHICKHLNRERQPVVKFYHIAAGGLKGLIYKENA